MLDPIRPAAGRRRSWRGENDYRLRCDPSQTAGRAGTILAHRDELLDQAFDKLKRAAGIVAAREQAGSHADLSDGVVVGSIQTLHVARLERWPAAHFKTIIIDEAHRGIAQTYRKGRIRRTHLASGALRQNSPGKLPFREPSRHALKAK
jgi:hypothetical protein